MNIIETIKHWKRKQRWNRQYKKGRWDNLRNDRESIRYKSIVQFTEKHSVKKPHVLALGCGEGILFEYFQNTPYTSFLGMDFSSVSIEKAKTLPQKNSEFICADLLKFTPKQKYDVIVFNEVFYYIHESEKQNVLDRMIAHLNDNGLLIISIYREGLGCWEYFEDERLEQLEFKILTTDEEKTYWKMGVYRV